jgi:hypothetical protein
MKKLSLAAALSLVSACSHVPVLQPDPAASLAPGSTDVATAQVAGVRLFVSGDKWNADPQNLGDVFTPVQVTIDNNSNRALRLAYEEFKLNGSTGFVHAALPPLQAKGVVNQAARRDTKRSIVLASYEQATGDAPTIVPAYFEHDGFYVAPHLMWGYPGWDAWPGAFPYDPLYYDQYYAYWPEHLPTKAMLSDALLEGAVQNGGKVTGFLYFQPVTSSEPRVSFEMDLVDANNGQTFGHVSIPFDVKK